MSDLAARAAALGIESEYIDARGERQSVPEQTLERLLEALGAASTDAAPTPSLIVRRGGRGEPPRFKGLLPVPGWRILSGNRELGRGSADGTVVLPDSAPLSVARLVPEYSADVLPEAPERDRVANVIVAPAKAYQMEDVRPERFWVLAVQLYSVRSGRNWGIGDFTDLRDLVTLAAQVGAAGIGLNPLHALFDNYPEQASPYSPNSRLFLNPFYLDLEAVPEFPGVAALGLADEIGRLRETPLVDYAGVGAAKVKALEACYAAFLANAAPERRAAFAAFRAERGRSLRRFAAFEVLRRRFQRVWWEWPEEWRNPEDDAIDRLHAEAENETGYFAYVQWLADGQLAACQNEAKRLGLPVGLYIDLAVGVEPGGADAWGQQGSMVPRVEVGAPPDLLNTAGQAWGLAAFNPRALEAEGFAPFSELLAAAMRHAGAIRLDHVLGLNRLYMIPFGMKPSEGAYVRYPLQALLAIVALHSVQQRCLVIGEDLGTVPDELRGILADWGIWSYLVMLFEREADGAFKAPEEYRANALASFSTHDLPTFAGWRSDHDLRVKRGLGLDPGETEETRDEARAAMVVALADAGAASGESLRFLDVVRFLARAESRMMVVGIEDVLGVEDQPNIPGTTTEHPNWRRRLPVGIDAFASHPELQAVAAVLREEGRAVGDAPAGGAAAATATLPSPGRTGGKATAKPKADKPRAATAAAAPTPKGGARGKKGKAADA